MDIEIEMNIYGIVEILKKIGFKEIKQDENVIEAKMPYGLGRIHVLGTTLRDGKFYLDVHWDFKIHFMFFGVDYASRPQKICEKIIEEASRVGAKAYMTGGKSWLQRRNKSLVKGLKVT